MSENNKKYIKKKLRDQEKILLISAITQIVFLDFKEYAVINCTVEIAKKLKFILALLMLFLKKYQKIKLELKKLVLNLMICQNGLKKNQFLFNR